VDRHQLEQETGLDARTIRFLISQQIVPEPNGTGRGASYEEAHVVAIRKYLALKSEGYKLDAIRKRIHSEIDTTTSFTVTDGLEIRFDAANPRYENLLNNPNVIAALEQLKLAAERN
jgi:DNA-binding transcriptional MerR regulator